MLRRVWRSLTTWPSATQWRQAVVVGLTAIAAIALIGGMAGLLTWQPRWAPQLLMVFALPAFTEELIFRAPLPGQHETERPRLWLAAGVIVFTLWHVVEALTFLPQARLFLEPRFLTCAAILGTACAIMRQTTGSLWPAVIFHGLVVLAWQGLWGGTSAMRLFVNG